MNKILSLLLLVSISVFMSCKGDQGEMGPAGRDGMDGQDGIDGTNGQNGQDGQDGNANVKSWTTTIVSANWTPSGTDENNLALNVPIVTQAVSDNGLVMVYLKTTALGLDGTVWSALPFSLAYGSYTESFAFSVKPFTVTLKETSNDGLPVEPAGTVRVIAATSQGLARHPDLDWTNYEDVKKALQLVD